MTDYIRVCATCYYRMDSACRRFPAAVPVKRDHWCYEWRYAGAVERTITMPHQEGTFRPSLPNVPIENRIKNQYGAVEGILLEVRSCYNRPAIKLKERKTGTEIWCVFPDEIESEISNKANFSDVWHGQRVVLRGLIEYDSTGEISRITASEVRRVEPDAVNLKDIKDKEFTGRLSVLDYLEKFREGDIG